MHNAQVKGPAINFRRVPASVVTDERILYRIEVGFIIVKVSKKSSKKFSKKYSKKYSTF